MGVFKVSFLKDLIKAIRGTLLPTILMKVPLMGEALKTPMVRVLMGFLLLSSYSFPLVLTWQISTSDCANYGGWTVLVFILF